jgi:ATP-dependent RNA helicase DDX10/DBP4
VAARGLDFPLVDWVIQLDCPEDTDTYIHRVGRTARFERSGNSLIMLLPSERAFLEKLAERKVPIEDFTVKLAKTGSIKQQLNGMCFKDPELKYLGQKVLLLTLCYCRLTSGILNLCAIDFPAER